MGMTSRERLMATLEGRPVDRPAVNLYEVGGFDPRLDDPDPFNVYTDPSWRPLLQLAEERTDLIRMRGPRSRLSHEDVCNEFYTRDTWTDENARFTRTTLRVGGRTMTELTRRDRDIDTTWHIEHLLKDAEDLHAFLELPDEVFEEEHDVTPLFEADAAVGDRGIVMVDSADPVCMAASLFSMQTYILVAYSEPELFHRLLEKFARPLYARAETVAREFPGHLWRVVGPEYATEPYLPPALFEEYVVRYTRPIIESIQRHGGYARLHSHGRIRSALPLIASMGPAALDPIEPPPQGDVELADVRREYGRDLVLFGNIEVSDVENLGTPAFEKVVEKALRAGTSGKGRGFVLMPTAAPYGRQLSPLTLANYEAMVRLAVNWS